MNLYHLQKQLAMLAEQTSISLQKSMDREITNKQTPDETVHNNKLEASCKSGLKENPNIERHDDAIF